MHRIVEFASELGVKLYPGQAQALDAYYRSGKQYWLFLAGRRGGKSLISDLVALYEAIVVSFADLLRLGEERFILIISVRQDNANQHIRNIANLLRKSRTFSNLIKAEMTDRIELVNGVTILSLPASARAGRGYGASCLIMDEAAFFMDAGGNSSANEVFTALEPTLATFGDRARLIITTSVGARVGLVYDIFSRAEELDGWFVTRMTSQELNPKISDKIVSNALKKDAEAGAAEYLSEFRDPVEAFLNPESIDAAIDPSLRESSGPQKGQTYMMAIDPALLGDHYAFVIAHRFGGNVILDYARALHPPIEPLFAESILQDLAAKFKPVKIYCDTAATTERLRGKLPALEYTPFSRPLKLRIYGSLKEALNLGKITLYPQEELLDELRALQIRNGNDISAPKAGRVKHDDLADCLALCVDGLGGNEWAGVGWIPDPFSEGDLSPVYDQWEKEYGRKYPGRTEAETSFFDDGSTERRQRAEDYLRAQAQKDALINRDTINLFWKTVRRRLDGTL